MGALDRSKRIDVFVSHSAKNARLAHTMVDALKASGFTTWIAPDDVRPGASYAQEITSALDESRAVLLLLTPDANASGHVAKEIDYAVTKDVPILPVRIANVEPAQDLALLLRLCQWVDLFPGKVEEKMDRLVVAVRSALAEEPAKAEATGGPLPESPLPKPPRPKRRWPMLAAAAAVLAVLGAAAVYSLVPPVGFDAITAPADGASVAIEAHAAGTADPARGRTLYLVVHTLDPDRYYPQDPALDPGWRGEWTSRVFFGTDGDAGQAFELLLVEGGSSVIEDYLALARESGSWEGLATLPSDAKIRDTVSTTRH